MNMSRIKGGSRYRKGFLMLLVIVVLLALVGLLLPSTFEVQRSAEIKARPAAVFAYLNNVQKWKEWTSLNVNKDFSLETEFFGPMQGIGSGMEYKGDKLGNGKIQITDNEQDNRVNFDLFINNKIHTKGEMILEPSGSETTLVTITLKGNVGFNLPNRYIILFMDNVVGALFDDSLHQLKTVVESKKPTSGSPL